MLVNNSALNYLCVCLYGTHMMNGEHTHLHNGHNVNQIERNFKLLLPWDRNWTEGNRTERNGTGKVKWNQKRNLA